LASSFDSIPLLTGEKTLRKVNMMPLKDESILAMGMLSMALGILIGRFLHLEYSGFSVTDFTEGILTGLSLVLNLVYLIRRRKK
jgi:hypothetical protein